MSTSLPTTSAANSPFRQFVTSAAHHIDISEWSINTRALGIEGTPCTIAKRRLHGGRQQGVDLITIDNGRMVITVIPTRGMGILKVESADIDLGWDSPVKEVVHPQFVNLQSRGGLGWLEGFNEWLVRCGLEFAGGPGRDKFTTNTGEVAETDLTLHGKIANIPASEVEVVIDRTPPFAIRLRGKVEERMFYGPKLELWTELTVEPSATTFRLEDTIANRGGAEQEFELIYHVNFGPPLLEAGGRFVGAAKRVTPMNVHATKGLPEYATYSAPTAGFVEQVYCMQLLPGLDGRATVILSNAAGDRAVSMSYLVEQLPCFTLWKSTSVASEGYVTGLEPGTNYPHNRRVEREAGRLGKLGPGESRQLALDFALHASRETVQGIIGQVTRLQAQRPPQIDQSPA